MGPRTLSQGSSVPWGRSRVTTCPVFSQKTSTSLSAGLTEPAFSAPVTPSLPLWWLSPHDGGRRSCGSCGPEVTPPVCQRQVLWVLLPVLPRLVH